MQTFDLGGGYAARPLRLIEYERAMRVLEGRVFGTNSTYDFGPPHKLAPPRGETLTWGVYAGAELVGWSHALQTDERTILMADTGLLPTHQGRGLYSRLLPHLLHTFRRAGYLLVRSEHRATNNRVLIPKLRAGFVVQGLSLYEGGLNATLTLSLDAVYRDAQHVRSGFRPASGEAARRLGVTPGPVTPPGVPAPVALPGGAVQAADLGGGYTLHRVSYAAYREVYGRLERAAHASVTFGWTRPALQPAPELPRYTWLIARGAEVVGWQFSRGWDARTAFMVDTALLPGHRGAGVYARLLPAVLGVLRAEGYDVIRSHQHATNTAALLPKLRAGFCLQGLEVDERGVMAVLLHSFDAVYRQYMDVRSGLTRPRGEVARRLGLEG